MSCCPTLDDFLTSYGIFIRQCARLLSPQGKFAILMGDYSDRRAGFIPLTYHTKQIAFAAGLQQASTDIIRFSHGASSGKKSYRSSFIAEFPDEKLKQSENSGEYGEIVYLSACDDPREHYPQVAPPVASSEVMMPSGRTSPSRAALVLGILVYFTLFGGIGERVIMRYPDKVVLIAYYPV